MARSKVPKLPPIPESKVLKACLAILKLSGVFAWRNNTGAFVGEHKGKSRYIRAGLPGSTDILGLVPGDGRMLCVEVKRKGCSPTPKQLAFMGRVNAAGGVAFWLDESTALERILPAILAGARVYLDDDGMPWLTDETG